MATKDYYETLGVDKNASADDIKSAYRRLAKKYHPDLYAQKSEAERKDAENKFKDVQHAYDVLSDPQKKAAYDQYGSEDGPQGFGGGSGFSGFSSGGFSDFGDIFSDIFSGFGGGRTSTRRTNADRDGDDLEVTLSLTFREAFFGVEKEITFKRVEKCRTCGGSGAKNGTSVKTCPKCGGRGTIVVQQRTMFGTMQSQTVCDVCHGSGKVVETPCPDCNGQGVVRGTKTLKIKVPAGVGNNQMMTLQGEGSAGRGRGANGNLIIIFKVAPHALFKREGQNLFLEYPITVAQAVLGDKIDVPTMSGDVTLAVPAGTQDGTTFRIKGRGVKSLRGSGVGDLFVKVSVDVPKNLSSKQRKQMEELAEVLSDAKYDKIEKFKKAAKEI